MIPLFAVLLLVLSMFWFVNNKHGDDTDKGDDKRYYYTLYKDIQKELNADVTDELFIELITELKSLGITPEFGDLLRSEHSSVQFVLTRIRESTDKRADDSLERILKTHSEQDIESILLNSQDTYYYDLYKGVQERVNTHIPDVLYIRLAQTLHNLGQSPNIAMLMQHPNPTVQAILTSIKDSTDVREDDWLEMLLKQKTRDDVEAIFGDIGDAPVFAAARELILRDICPGQFETWSPCRGTSRSRRYIPTDNMDLCRITEVETSCPVDCEGSFGTWSPCEGLPERTRRYTIAVNAENGGTHCPHPEHTQTETTCPVECDGSFTTWTPCDGSRSTRMRAYQVARHEKNGGKKCEHPEHTETATDCPVDCVGAFSPWSTCDGNGRDSTRVYTISRQHQNGGSTCAHADGTEQAQTTCPVECLGTWSPLEDCEQIPDGVERTATYAILTPGDNCEAQDGESKVVPCAPIDCITTGWENVSECDAECGQEGTISQVRRTKPAKHGGFPGSGTRRVRCTSTCEPIDCVGTWEPMGECVSECHLPEAKHTQKHVFKRLTVRNGGQACATQHGTERLMRCTDGSTCPPVDCEGTWTPWDSTECDTDGVMQTKDFIQHTRGMHGGVPCPDVQHLERTCEPVDCEGTWLAWDKSGCAVDGGVQVKEYVADVDPKHGGAPCPRDLERTCPPVDCGDTWPPWDDSLCTHDLGVQTRYHLFDKPGRNGGAPCPHPNYEERTCEPVECQGTWGPWDDTGCDADVGVQTKEFRVDVKPKHGGRDCEASDGEARERTCEPVDCQGTWGAWDDTGCDAAVGVQTKEFRVDVKPKHGGIECPSTRVETRSCDAEHCVGTWQPLDDSCNESDGQRVQRYTIISNSAHGGDPCPENIVTTCPPVDCEGTWGPWDVSSCVNADGTQRQPFLVSKEAMHGGVACPNDLERTCEPVDCEGTWSPWDYLSCGNVGSCRSRQFLTEVPSMHRGEECVGGSGGRSGGGVVPQ